MMKAKDVILVTTRLTADDFKGSRLVKTQNRVKHAIQTVRAFGLNPIVVLGPAGDEFLRSCPELEDCDLAYDPNYAGGLFSGIHAGVHAATGASFVLPIDVESADEPIWRALDAAGWALKPEDVVHVFQAMTVTDGDSLPAFPQLITRAGVQHLRALAPETAWDGPSDIKFRVLHTIAESKSDRTA